MPVNKHLMDKLQRLQELLKQKKSKKFYSERLGITIQEVEELLEELRNEGVDLDIEGTTQKYNFDKGTVEISAFYKTPPTPEQVIKDHKIDENNYKLSAFYSKGKGDKGWLVTGLFKNITKEEQVVNSFQEFLKTYKSDYKPEKSICINDKFSNPTMVEISLADAHIDKWGLEGASIEEHCDKYLSILDNLIVRAYQSNNIEEIVFVCGNDYFNADNWQNGTTLHCNIQDINERWDLAYEKGFDTLVKAITKLKHYCKNLKVIMVQGNHAKTKEFFLGHALEVYFKDNKDIAFDRTSAPRKIHVYHNTAIMYHHGNCKIDQLPLIMASEFPEQWGSTKFHRVHTGDKHFYMEKEISGVRIKQYPSISQTDRWHNENNYILNGRVGLLNVFDRIKGRIAEYEEIV